jgi:hypothetical protein
VRREGSPTAATGRRALVGVSLLSRRLCASSLGDEGRVDTGVCEGDCLGVAPPANTRAGEGGGGGVRLRKQGEFFAQPHLTKNRVNDRDVDIYSFSPPGVTLGDGLGEGLGMFFRSCLTVPRLKRTLTGRLLRMPALWKPMTTVEPGRPKIRGLVKQEKIRVRKPRTRTIGTESKYPAPPCSDQFLLGCIFSLGACPCQSTNTFAQSSGSDMDAVTLNP